VAHGFWKSTALLGKTEFWARFRTWEVSNGMGPRLVLTGKGVGIISSCRHYVSVGLVFVGL